MEKRPPIRRVAANILNKQFQTADKGLSKLGVGEMLTTPHRNNVLCYEPFTKKASDLD